MGERTSLTTKTRLENMGFVTRNRHQLLGRSIQSYLRHLEDFGRRCRIAILDASDNLQDQQICREWLTTIGRDKGLDLCYGGWSEKEAFVEAMAKRGFERDVLAFLFHGCDGGNSPGANRNALLLQYAGEAFVSCDDDSVCRTFDLRDGDQNARFLKTGVRSLDAYFFDSLDEAVAAAPEQTADLLASHESLLGVRLPDIGLKGSEDANGPCSSTKRALDSDDAQIAITMSGVVGDSGVPDVSGFLFAHPCVVERFLTHCSERGDFSISRNIIRGVSRPSVSNDACMFTTTATGFDNRQLLPPFLPCGEGEDSLFGLLIRLCAPNLFLSHLPVGLLHSPPRSRRCALPRTALSMSMIIGAVIAERLACSDDPPHARYRKAGECLEEVASEDMRMFNSNLERLRRRILEQWVDFAECRVQEAEAFPPLWHSAVRRWIGEIEQKLDARHIEEAYCLDSLSMHPVSLEFVRVAMRRFGGALRQWPEIVAEARQSRQHSELMAAQPILQK